MWYNLRHASRGHQQGNEEIRRHRDDGGGVVRCQYPDLKIGPAYSREEGLDRLGIVAGVTLPLWNCNRKGIAEAEGERDEAKQDAIRIWREIVLEAAASRRTLERLKSHPSPPTHAIAGADALFDVGEITPLEYLTIREELLDSELAEITWRRDLRLAEENLKNYEMKGL